MNTQTADAKKELVGNLPVPDWWPVQPLGRVALLTILSLFVYLFLWLWRAMRALGVVWGRFRRPGWRMLGLLAPVYGLVVIWEVLDEVRKRLSEVGLSPVAPPWLFLTAWFVCGVACHAENPIACLVGVGFALAVLLGAQRDLNRLFAARHEFDGRCAPWRAADITIAVVFGIIWLAAILAGGGS